MKEVTLQRARHIRDRLANEMANIHTSQVVLAQLSDEEMQFLETLVYRCQEARQPRIEEVYRLRRADKVT